MGRPLIDKWVQPFGVFAFVGAALRDDLCKLMLEAIISLESKGEKILVSISDGAATNKKAWELSGLGETSS